MLFTPRTVARAALLLVLGYSTLVHAQNAPMTPPPGASVGAYNGPFGAPPGGRPAVPITLQGQPIGGAQTQAGQNTQTRGGLGTSVQLTAGLPVPAAPGTTNPQVVSGQPSLDPNGEPLPQPEAPAVATQRPTNNWARPSSYSVDGRVGIIRDVNGFHKLISMTREPLVCTSKGFVAPSNSLVSAGEVIHTDILAPGALATPFNYRLLLRIEVVCQRADNLYHSWLPKP